MKRVDRHKRKTYLNISWIGGGGWGFFFHAVPTPEANKEPTQTLVDKTRK